VIDDFNIVEIFQLLGEDGDAPLRTSRRVSLVELVVNADLHRAITSLPDHRADNLELSRPHSRTPPCVRTFKVLSDSIIGI